MGNCTASNDYYNFEGEQELKLRNFEKETLKLPTSCYFGDILRSFESFCLGRDSSLTAKDIKQFFKNEGLNELFSLTELPFFTASNKIDEFRIKCLFFLLAPHKRNSSPNKSQNNFDKASFIYFSVIDSSEALDLPIMPDNSKLLALLENLVELSTSVLVSFYSQQSNKNPEDLTQLSQFREQTVRKLKKILFSNSRNNLLSLSDLNSLFSDNYFMFSGYLRELTLEAVRDVKLANMKTD